MSREDKLYKISEIALAAGVSRHTISARRNRLGIPANRKGYRIEDVKKMLRRGPTARMSKKSAMELREQLKNDGYL